MDKLYRILFLTSEPVEAEAPDSTIAKEELTFMAIVREGEEYTFEEVQSEILKHVEEVASLTSNSVVCTLPAEFHIWANGIGLTLTSDGLTIREVMNLAKK